MVTAVLVAGAGALGALARYGVGVWVGVKAPWLATLTVNVIGSFLLGVLAGVVVLRSLVDAPLAVAASVGFLGAFTTFSTFSIETLTLIDDGRVALALGYALGSVVTGVAAAALGSVAARVVV